MRQTWWMRVRAVIGLARFRLAMRIYRWLQPHYRWSREWYLRRVREPNRIPLRYHLLALRGHLRYRAAMALWRLRRPWLLFDLRTWWAMVLTESRDYGGRHWDAGAYITKDDRVIVSHRRDRMDHMAQELGWRMVRLPALPPRYILWEDWVSPLYR